MKWVLRGALKYHTIILVFAAVRISHGWNTDQTRIFL